MPNNEDLLREIEEQERRDDSRYQQSAGMRELSKLKPIARRRADNRTPMQRFEQDIKPVLERRKRVEAGLPISSNPFYNAYLRLTGQDKLPVVELVEPDKQYGTVGQTVDEIRQIISENPQAFRHLSKSPEHVRATGAKKKTVEDLIRASEIRGPIKLDDEAATT